MQADGQTPIDQIKSATVTVRRQIMYKSNMENATQVDVRTLIGIDYILHKIGEGKRAFH